MSISKLKNFEKQGKFLLNGGFAIIAAEAVRANTDLLEELNREQMLEGEDSEGNEITPKYRSAIYAAQKPSNPKRKFLTPNLKNTGAFHRSIRATLSGQSIRFNATDSKKAKLLAKYGKVLGLNKAGLEKYKDQYLKAAIVRRVVKLLLG